MAAAADAGGLHAGGALAAEFQQDESCTVEDPPSLARLSRTYSSVGFGSSAAWRPAASTAPASNTNAFSSGLSCRAFAAHRPGTMMVAPMRGAGQAAASKGMQSLSRYCSLMIETERLRGAAGSITGASSNVGEIGNEGIDRRFRRLHRGDRGGLRR